MSIRDENGNVKRSVKMLAMALGLMFVVGATMPYASVAEDVSKNEVDQITDPTLSSLEVYDACWNTENKVCVAVGNVPGNTVNDALFYATNLASWNSLGINLISDNYYFRGVDFDASSNTFVMAGGSQADAEPIIWLWQTWVSVTELNAANTNNWPSGYGVVTDVAVYRPNCFVATFNSGYAFSFTFSGGVWSATEIGGALPLAGGSLNSVTYDSDHGLVYIYGTNSGGDSCNYYSYGDDLTSGWPNAFNMNQVGENQAIFGADWSSTAHAGIEAGANGWIDKLTVNHAMTYPDFGAADAFTQPPPKRIQTAYAHSPYTRNVYMFGGYNASSGQWLQDTWKYNIFSRQWTLLNPATKPPVRSGHAMAFDPDNNLIIMYGGVYSGGYLGDTWVFDPNTEAWTLRSVTQDPPGSLPLQSGHSMVYSNSFGVLGAGIVVYGGSGGTTSFYHYSDASGTWTRVVPVGDSRVATQDAAMCVDLNTGNIVLFGGQNQEGATICYYPSTNYWDNKGVPSPPSRIGGAMEWSYAAGKAMLYGGYSTGMGQYFNDIWSYQDGGQEGGGAWNVYAPTITPPKLGYHKAIIAAENAYSIYYFGGSDETGMSSKVTMLGRALSFTKTQISTVLTSTWRSVCWRPGSAEAIIAGDNGYICKYTDPKKALQNVDQTYNGGDFYAVAWKGSASPSYALALGSAGGGIRVNDITSGTGIVINAAGPFVSQIYLNVTGTISSCLNRQVDVDSGTSNTVYRLNATVGHMGGYGLVTQVDIYMWYDGGITGLASEAVTGAGFDNNVYANERIHIRWTSSPDVFTVLCPTPAPGTEETSFLSGMRNLKLPNSQEIVVDFSPHQQIRSSTSVFTEPSGQKYIQQNSTGAAALNDPYTWDIKVVAWSGALNEAAYDEFGIFKYTYLSSSALPGALTGSGAPGSMVYMRPTGNVSFSANCNYKLKAYVDSDLVGVNLGSTISAGNMGLRGGNLDNATLPGTPQAFAGAGSVNALYILGGASSVMTPERAGRTTSTALGAYGVMTWRCYVPSVPQDHYLTSVTYVLQWA